MSLFVWYCCVDSHASHSSSSSSIPSVSSSTLPHALQSFSAIETALRGHSVSVYLDYDGTCTPIVNDPTAAILTDSMRDTIDTLSQHYPTAIVTGRKYDTIIGFVRLPHLYYAGSHGFDIREPNGVTAKQVAAEYLPALGKVRDEIKQKVQHIQGSLVEDNTFSISVHYRNIADPQRVEELHQIVQTCYAPYASQLQLLPGKMVHEIRPQFDWHKGQAVSYLLQTIQQQTSSSSTASSDIAPVCLGDDTTDEDAFRTLQSLPHSVTVLVLPDSGGERQTNAKYVCQQHEVETLLKQLANIQ